MLIAAERAAKGSVDTETLSIYSSPPFTYAHLETPVVVDSNGLESWTHLSCAGRDAGRGQWSCDAAPIRGFHISLAPGESPRPMQVRTDAHGVLNPDLISRAVALLSVPSDVQECLVTGHKRKRSTEWLHRELANTPKTLEYDLWANESILQLSNQAMYVEFSIPAHENEAPRIICWAPIEIVVTS